MTADQATDGRQVRVLERELISKGHFKILRFRLAHDSFAGGEGIEVTREIFDRGGAVAVLPYDPVRDEVVLIEQFRAGVFGAGEDPWLIETVAGLMEPGEVSEEVARRETLEEAGLELGALQLIARYFVSPGGSTETVDLYLGMADTAKAGGLFGLAEEGEDIKVHVLSAEEAFGWLDQGRISHATAIIALQWLRANRERLRGGAKAHREP